jgi:hypothetical protein
LCRRDPVLAVEALSRPDHEPVWSMTVGAFGVGVDIPGARDDDTVMHERGAGATRCVVDEVERAELVVLAPATPVAQR